jgi:hypothetical protein
VVACVCSVTRFPHDNHVDHQALHAPLQALSLAFAPFLASLQNAADPVLPVNHGIGTPCVSLRIAFVETTIYTKAFLSLFATETRLPFVILSLHLIAGRIWIQYLQAYNEQSMAKSVLVLCNSFGAPSLWKELCL